MERVIPYWDDFIVPNIKRGQRILIVAHGTVLRSLIKYLDGKFYFCFHNKINTIIIAV